MDGTQLAVAETDASSGFALVPNRPDALSRIICFGHALRTTSEYLDDKLFGDAHEPTLAMMNHAFDRLADRRPDFTPEEFTLLVMSNLIGRCKTPEEDAVFRRGAAAYILRAAPKLPGEYAPIINDARQLLSRAGEGPKGADTLHERVVTPQQGRARDRRAPAMPEAQMREPAVSQAGPMRPAPAQQTARRATAPSNELPYARDRETLKHQPRIVAKRSERRGLALTIIAMTTLATLLVIGTV